MRRSLQAAAALAVLWPSAAAAQTPTARICAIQGTDPRPALLGARVVVSGIVTADFSGTEIEGFFLQEPACDADPATSDAVFVRTGARRAGLAVGHRATVTGRVTDDFGLTAVLMEGATDGGAFAGGLEAVRLSPPADPAAAAAYLEAHEAMLVSLPRSRVVAATNRSGEAYLMPESSGLGRLYGGGDDGRKLALAVPGSWLALDHGDRVVDASGPLAYTFGQFKVLLRAGRSLGVEREGAAPAAAPPSTPDTVTVATYNLEDLFDAVDDPARQDEVPTPERYAADLARRAASIGQLLGAPDVVGVQEVESLEVLQALAAQPELAPFAYQAVLLEGADARGIDVGLLYRSDRLSLRSVEARPACTALKPESPAAGCVLGGGAPGHLLFGRPPLVARLAARTGGETLTVVVNHFLAQGGDAALGAATRLAMAEHVAALVAELKAAEPETPVVVLGDLNDFEDSATLARLAVGARLANPGAAHGRERSYTYTFQGLSQTLDYVLADPALASRVVEARAVHVNVDFGAPPPGGAGHRVSDHDPVLLTIRKR
jgi:predicted extracellular nuclease